jgi:hypothetical protein
VPHLCDGFIVDEVGYFRGSENADILAMPLGLKRHKEKATTTSSLSVVTEDRIDR